MLRRLDSKKCSSCVYIDCRGSCCISIKTLKTPSRDGQLGTAAYYTAEMLMAVDENDINPYLEGEKGLEVSRNGGGWDRRLLDVMFSRVYLFFSWLGIGLSKISERE